MTDTLGSRLTRSQGWLDTVADRLQPAVSRAVGTSTALRNALDGTWLGTPLHPALTDVPIGAWTAASALDALESATDSEALRHAADGALAVGVLAALPAAMTGASDWRDLRGESRRIATLHGLLNATGLVLSLASLGLRASGRRGVGRACSGLGMAVSSAAAHLGGELSYGLGVRVNRTAWESGPSEFTAVLREEELVGQELRRVEADGVPLVLARSTAGSVCAISATCSHLGGPLDGGERREDTVVCPWHGSRFELCTGEVVDGPAVFSQPRYETRVRDGSIEVRSTSA